MKSIVSAFALCLVSAIALANNPTYEWEKTRARFTLTPKEESLTELILKQHVQYEYVFIDEAFLMYSTTHRIIYVNSNEAIQKHNRIVISMNNALELVDLKARAINKDGKSVYFDKSNLKELKEEESGNAYRIFAIEGVEMGSEIEYYYTRKMYPGLFERAYMQSDVVIKNSSFMLSCPKHLKFDFKSYNGYESVKEQEKEDEEKNVYRVSMTNVSPMKEESYSNYDANRKRIEFKLAYNTARSQARLYTWDDAAKKFYNVLSENSKDDEKALEKFIKTLGDNPSDKTEVRIRKIESKIKTTIQVNTERGDENLSKIESILKYKIASREGVTKLFMTLFTKLKINCYPVVTCSRENAKFDAGFDSWGYLDDYILYFPDTKGFLAPYSFESRYPLVPSQFTSQKGLFIEPFVMGDLKSALGSVQDIPAADYQLNVDNMDINASFSDDFSTVIVDHTRSFSGYNAIYIAPYYNVMTEEQRTKLIDELTKGIAPDATIKTWKAKVDDGKDVLSFDITTTYHSTHFIEKAGPRFLFKVGQLIGPQSEMYRDDERVTDIENDYNRGYARVIKVKIPDGYSFKNLNDLNFDVAYLDKNEKPFLFHSSYSLNGNALEIKIDEYYKQIYAPLARYEDYRKVINAAADFNKVTLVLEKVK
ncbi:DUF3857 domain-containing protein [Pseudochryseolinea flava]|uniref:DUF3857 domain-containing protein n=1 Tax=Pseudochryseolinea flava TaxID=2059302 RepID=UPI0014024951|nr:DUF3857 domain-containing protein [Pseudochryseolinea flava]